MFAYVRFDSEIRCCLRELVHSDPMTTSLRQTAILDIARRHGRVGVEHLAGEFGVAQQTIRRDLTEMAEAGLLARVHGGAVLPSGTHNIAHEERRSLNAAAKDRIARACADEIGEGASVFLNIGTTTEAVARALMGHSSLLAVTNNSKIAEILADAPGIEVVVTGGTLRRADGGLIGPLSLLTIRHFRYDVAVIGCSALHDSGDILDFDLAEVEASRAIIAQSRKVILVADHSKFQRSAPVRIGSLSEVDQFLTDRAVPAGLTEACAGWNTRIVVV